MLQTPHLCRCRPSSCAVKLTSIALLSSPVKSCSLASLSQCHLPGSRKLTPSFCHFSRSQHSSRSSHSADMANFRPILNLSFLSKVTERALIRQLNMYLLHIDTIRPRRPYCASSRTLWQLLTIVRWSCLPCLICRQHLTVWTREFDFKFSGVDHSVLLVRLQRNFGLNGAVLRWLTSF